LHLGALIVSGEPHVYSLRRSLKCGKAQQKKVRSSFGSWAMVSTSQWGYRFFLDGFLEDFLGTDSVAVLAGLVSLLGADGLGTGFNVAFGGGTLTAAGAVGAATAAPLPFFFVAGCAVGAGA